MRSTSNCESVIPDAEWPDRNSSNSEEAISTRTETGGTPGFVKVVGLSVLAFPDYFDSGMFKSLGNILSNPSVGSLFIDMGEKPRRVRVNGEAAVSSDAPLMKTLPSAQLLVRVKARAIFPNCRRYIVTPEAAEPSECAPRAGYEPPEPAWKGFDDFRGYIHPRQKTSDGE